MDNTNLVLHSEISKDISTYHSHNMNYYYKMVNPIEYANTHFYAAWENINTKEIIKYWFQDPARFRQRPSVVYLKRTLRMINQYLLKICCILHGKKNTKHFEENWIFLLNLVFTRGRVFNWKDILSYELRCNV